MAWLGCEEATGVDAIVSGVTGGSSRSRRSDRSPARVVGHRVARGRRRRLAAASSVPTSAHVHSATSQVSVARTTCTHTMSAGRCSSYWTLPTSPWAATSTPSTVSGSSSSVEAPRWRRSSQTPTTATPNTRGDRRVTMDHPVSVSAPLKVRRWICCPERPPECGPAAVAAVPAKIVSAGQRRQHAHRPDR